MGDCGPRSNMTCPLLSSHNRGVSLSSAARSGLRPHPSPASRPSLRAEIIISQICFYFKGTVSISVTAVPILFYQIRNLLYLRILSGRTIRSTMIYFLHILNIFEVFYQRKASLSSVIYYFSLLVATYCSVTAGRSIFR